MPSVNATFAWAVPVKVEILGCHLEAYINLQPTIKALRLCHRFGRGPKTSITRLPVELVNNIEDYLMADERGKTSEEWAADFMCHQLECYPQDHYTEEELKRMEPLALLDEDFTDVESALEYYVKVNMAEEWLERHWDAQNRWQERAGNKEAGDRGFFGQQHHFFYQHFRLQTWISHVRLDEAPSNSFWTDEDNDDCATETTVAYLKLPATQTFTESWRVSLREIDNFDFQMESGYGIPVGPLSEPSEKEQARFKRAMNILELKPQAHPSQAAARWSVESASSKKMRVSWKPQLTLLLRNTAVMTKYGG